MNAPPTSLAATRSTTTSGFSLYTVIIGLTLLAVLNPLSIRLAIKFGGSGNAYVLMLDLCLVVVVVLAVLHLRTGRRRFGTLAAIGVAAIIPIMVAAEFALTYVHNRFYTAWSGVKVSNVYEPDAKFGWRLARNTNGHHFFPGNFDVRYGTDALGRRKVPKAAVSSPTVHVFGSSFTFSDGVNDEEAAIYVLAEANRDHYQMVNYSVSAYGLDQMVLSLEANQNAIAPGDVVMLAPTAISLSWNWIEKGKPCLSKIAPGGYPVDKIPHLTPAGWRFIDLRTECGTLEALVLNSPFVLGWVVKSLRADYTWKATIEHSDVLFAHARKIVEARGARFLPFMIVNADECRLKQYSFDLTGLETPFISMMPYCPTDQMKLDGLNFPNDWHYTVKGNRWLAGVLGEMLSKNVPGLD